MVSTYQQNHKMVHRVELQKGFSLSVHMKSTLYQDESICLVPVANYKSREWGEGEATWACSAIPLLQASCSALELPFDLAIGPDPVLPNPEDLKSLFEANGFDVRVCKQLRTSSQTIQF